MNLKNKTGILDSFQGFSEAYEKLEEAYHHLLSYAPFFSSEVLSVKNDFAPQVIILKNGMRVPLSFWQELHNLPSEKFSEYFSFQDKKLNRSFFQLSELLFLLADAFRKKVGKPVIINSGYRSQQEQDLLKRKGFKAATYSPHTQGMAFDIDTTSKNETLDYVKILEEVSRDLGIKIRIGWNAYFKIGQTFVHVDVCPEYYAKGKPFFGKTHPEAWEREARW